MGNAMETSAPPTDPLRVFLSGKRRHERHAVSLPVEVSGAGASFPGRAIDLSNGGAMVAITERALQHICQDGEDLLGVVNRCLADGFDLRFPDQRVVAEAHPVRLSVPSGPEGVLLIGCKFASLLGTAQRRALSLEDGPAADDDVAQNGVGPMESLPLEPRRGAMPQVLIYDQSQQLVGPRYAGQVTGMGGRAFSVRVPLGSPKDVTACLGNRTFEVRFMVGEGPVWAAKAQLVAARFVDVPGGGVEVALLTEAPPSRVIRRQFRRRRAA